MQEFSEISVSQIIIKWKSKKEVYNLLTNEGGFYLPPLIDSNYKYISQVLVSDKKAMKWKAIKVWSIPHLDSLTISEILQFASDHFEVEEYIHSYEYYRHPNRNWLGDIINTACQKEFKQFFMKRFQIVLNMLSPKGIWM